MVVGGGIAGTCAALSGARNGLRVALVQDRPVLGGADKWGLIWSDEFDGPAAELERKWE